MILTLSSVPTATESDFFQQTLTQNDHLLLTANSISLAFQENKFEAQGLVRENDLQKVGAICHASWTVISDIQWLEATVNADKCVTW